MVLTDLISPTYQRGWHQLSVRLTIPIFIQCVATGSTRWFKDSTGFTDCSSRTGRGAKKPGGGFSSSSYTVWSTVSETESVNPRTNSPQAANSTSGIAECFQFLRPITLLYSKTQLAKKYLGKEDGATCSSAFPNLPWKPKKRKKKKFKYSIETL